MSIASASLTPPAGNMPALDGIRGVAILMVVLTHCGGGRLAALSLWQDTQAMGPTFALPPWIDAIAGQAFHGVSLFFVVSAFTLTIQAGRRRDGLLAYAGRRLARVGPAYWLAGLCYGAAAGTVPRLWAPDGVQPLDCAIAALFGSAWQGGAAMAVIPGGWSVSVELAFYVALPAVLFAIGGRMWRAMLLAALSVLGVQLFYRYQITHGEWHYVPHYIFPPVQLPLFLAGIAAALAAERVRLPAATRPLAIVLLAVIVLAVPFTGYVVKPWYMLPHLLVAVLAAASVLIAAQHPPRLLDNRLMRTIGQVSYSMYLIHFIVLQPSLAVAEWLAPGNDWRALALHCALTASTSVAAAAVSYRRVEQPGIRWMAAFIARARPAATVAA